MITETDIAALEKRARDARVTMADVCRKAGKHRASWSRLKAVGRSRNTLFYDQMNDAMTAIERDAK